MRVNVEGPTVGIKLEKALRPLLKGGAGQASQQTERKNFIAK